MSKFLCVLFAFLAVVVLCPRVAPAYDSSRAVGAWVHGATSIGGRAAFYRPDGADHGAWAPGAQVRLRLSRTYTLEASADFSRHSFGPTKVRVIPVQATLLSYFYQDSSFSPYLLLGGGWYFTRVEGPQAHSQSRFGPHTGAGVELLFGGSWSMDCSYRALWTQGVHIKDASHPFGRTSAKKGKMVTLGLNYLF